MKIQYLKRQDTFKGTQIELAILGKVCHQLVVKQIVKCDEVDKIQDFSSLMSRFIKKEPEEIRVLLEVLSNIPGCPETSIRFQHANAELVSENYISLDKAFMKSESNEIFPGNKNPIHQFGGNTNNMSKTSPVYKILVENYEYAALEKMCNQTVRQAERFPTNNVEKRVREALFEADMSVFKNIPTKLKPRTGSTKKVLAVLLGFVGILCVGVVLHSLFIEPALQLTTVGTGTKHVTCYDARSLITTSDNVRTIETVVNASFYKYHFA